MTSARASSLSEEKQFRLIQRPLCLRTRIPVRGGGGPMGNGPQGGASAPPQADSRASAITGPRSVRRLARLKEWLFHKPKPEPYVLHPPAPVAAAHHQPDPPVIVLACARSG